MQIIQCRCVAAKELGGVAEEHKNCLFARAGGRERD